MIKIRWFFHLLTRALLERGSRTLLITLALALAAGLATSLVGLTVGMREKLGEELRVYGANFMINPRFTQIGSGGIGFGQVTAESYFSEKKMKQVLSGYQKEIAGYSFKLEVIATADGKDVSVSGVYFGQVKKLGGEWRIEGDWPREAREVLAGITLAERLKLSKGDNIILTTGGVSSSYRIAGIAETGGSEDKSILMDLKQAQTLFNLPDRINQVLVNARAYRLPLDVLARQLSDKAPEIEAKTLQQVAKAESELLDKILKLMLLVTVVVILATGIAVVNTFGAIVLERRQEIGLLKALGSSDLFVGVLFLSEGLAMSFGGAVTGYAGGIVLAELFARSAFNAWIALPWMLIAVALGTSFLVGVLASLGPVRSALKVDPAITLRGL
jgi:putative ABC transport system permease protein